MRDKKLLRCKIEDAVKEYVEETGTEIDFLTAYIGIEDGDVLVNITFDKE